MAGFDGDDAPPASLNSEKRTASARPTTALPLVSSHVARHGGFSAGRRTKMGSSATSPRPPSEPPPPPPCLWLLLLLLLLVLLLSSSSAARAGCHTRNWHGPFGAFGGNWTL